MKILIVLLLLVLGGCGGDKPRTPPINTGQTPTTGTTPPSNIKKTVKGVSVKSDTIITVGELNTIDSALSKLFSDVTARGYRNKVNYTDYTITIKLDCVDRSGTMSWLDRLDSYDGSEYDQDPRPGIGMIYRAEQVTLHPSKPPEFIICRDAESTMSNTTRFGAEHIILYYNDMNEYNRTAVHTTQGHPIIPEL